jgi:hypothetical protein
MRGTIHKRQLEYSKGWDLPAIAKYLKETYYTLFMGHGGQSNIQNNSQYRRYQQCGATNDIVSPYQRDRKEFVLLSTL